ncbi:hypothetical protein [Luedemannella flava]|uniref:hypothetical protein n=1 Tax=Luedemannella flava TaxID=349316 RepID=UPI0031E0686F
MAGDEPFVRRATFDRSDKTGLVGAVLWLHIMCCGLPAVPLMLLPNTIMPWAVAGYGALVLGSLLLIVTMVWRSETRRSGRLIIEITREGVRFGDDEPTVPWEDMVCVGGGRSRHTMHGAYHTERSYLTYRTPDGEVSRGIPNTVSLGDIRQAIERLKPGDPLPLE